MTDLRRHSFLQKRRWGTNNLSLLQVGSSDYVAVGTIQHNFTITQPKDAAKGRPTFDLRVYFPNNEVDRLLIKSDLIRHNSIDFVIATRERKYHEPEQWHFLLYEVGENSAAVCNYIQPIRNTDPDFDPELEPADREPVRLAGYFVQHTETSIDSSSRTDVRFVIPAQSNLVMVPQAGDRFEIGERNFRIERVAIDPKIPTSFPLDVVASPKRES